MLSLKLGQIVLRFVIAEQNNYGREQQQLLVRKAEEKAEEKAERKRKAQNFETGQKFKGNTERKRRSKERDRKE